MSYEYNPIPSLNQWMTSSPAKPTREDRAFQVLGALLLRKEHPISVTTVLLSRKLTDDLLAELGRGEGDTGNDETPTMDVIDRVMDGLLRDAMNCDYRRAVPDDELTYCHGHKHARHAIAEMVAAAHAKLREAQR